MISIPKNGHYKLPIYYLPITLEPHKCHLIFTDERVGEMQYEVKAEPTPPSQFDKPIKISTHLDTMEPQTIDISYKNHKMEYAIQKLKERVKESKSLTGKTDILKKIESIKENNTYQIECDQPFLQIPGQFALQSKKADGFDQMKQYEKSETNMATSDVQNRLPIILNYKFPVQNQIATIMMRNSARTDVRIYKLDITVMPKKVRAQLEMLSPARIALTQNIPIINTLSQNVEIRISFERTKNGEAFKIPYSDNDKFMVEPGQTQLKLVFEPEWVGEYSAKLNLSNKATNEDFEYELKGIGEEPLAEKEYVVE